MQLSERTPTIEKVWWFECTVWGQRYKGHLFRSQQISWKVLFKNCCETNCETRQESEQEENTQMCLQTQAWKTWQLESVGGGGRRELVMSWQQQTMGWSRKTNAVKTDIQEDSSKSSPKTKWLKMNNQDWKLSYHQLNYVPEPPTQLFNAVFW